MKKWFLTDPEYFIAGSRKSSIRYVMIQTVRIGWVLVITSVVVLFIMALKYGSVDWYGFAAFISSITVLVGSAITGKVIQHKQEQKFNNNGQGEQIRINERSDQESAGPQAGD